MWALFGDIALDIQPVEGFDLKDAWSYAEHGVVDGAPHVQGTGRDLRKVTLQVRLHWALGDPEELLDRLRQTADAGEAKPLSRGDGRTLGTFVIASLSEKPQWTFEDGKPIAVEARLQLREWLGEQAAGRPEAAAARGSPLARQFQPSPSGGAPANRVPADDAGSGGLDDAQAVSGRAITRR